MEKGVDFSEWELSEISDDEDNLSVIARAEKEAKMERRRTDKKSRVPRARAISTATTTDAEED